MPNDTTDVITCWGPGTKVTVGSDPQRKAKILSVTLNQDSVISYTVVFPDGSTEMYPSDLIHGHGDGHTWAFGPLSLE
jgi:hypothetical protein